MRQVVVSQRFSRTYLVQADRDSAKDVAVALATDANRRIRIGRGGAVKPAKGAGWWLVTLRMREERR